jgi:hypothetical protein
MADQELRDRVGKLLGRIRQLPDGRLELRDPIGRLKGHYNPKSNETRAPSGSLVAKGNVLSSLL